MNAVLPGRLDNVSFIKLARSYPMLASMSFEPAIGQPEESFDAGMVKNWHQLRTLGLASFVRADLSQLPRTVHTLRISRVDMQVSSMIDPLGLRCRLAMTISNAMANHHVIRRCHQPAFACSLELGRGCLPACMTSIHLLFDKGSIHVGARF